MRHKQSFYKHTKYGKRIANVVPGRVMGLELCKLSTGSWDFGGSSANDIISNYGGLVEPMLQSLACEKNVKLKFVG